MANANYLTNEALVNYAPDLDLSSYTPTTISGMIGTASRWVDSITNANKGWDFETLTDEEYSSKTSVHTNADGNLVIPLIKRPLNTVEDVTDIAICLGAYRTDLTLESGGESVLHSPDPGWSVIYPNTWLVSTGTLLSNQRLFNLRSFDYFIKLTYSAGYQVIPGDMQYATALIVQQIVAQKYNPAAAEQVKQGSISLRITKGTIGDESPLISQAKVFLRDYIRVV